MDAPVAVWRGQAASLWHSVWRLWLRLGIACLTEQEAEVWDNRKTSNMNAVELGLPSSSHLR